MNALKEPAISQTFVGWTEDWEKDKGALSLSGVRSLSTEGGEGWLAVSMLFVERNLWKECWSQFWWFMFFGRGFEQICFPSMTPSTSCTG